MCDNVSAIAYVSNQGEPYRVRCQTLQYKFACRQSMNSITMWAILVQGNCLHIVQDKIHAVPVLFDTQMLCDHWILLELCMYVEKIMRIE
jgi:hypothetical protein